MTALEYILSKQIQWALTCGIPLIGSKGMRGRASYTSELNQNLFEPLLPDVQESFSRGDGNEIIGSQNSPAKMQAVHSSSALAVNIFQYWRKIEQVPIISAACGLCRKGNNISNKIVFEEKYPIDSRFQFAPNIDIVIHNVESFYVKRFAIECKFSEAYKKEVHDGIRPQYINITELWEDVPELYGLAKLISPVDDSFAYLHPAQLIKHILGLKRAYGRKGFRLLYLWYDVLGEEGANHRKEIRNFSEIAKSDDIKFHELSYQELIVRLSNEYRSDHEKYINYITTRYL
jgi:hypothetical protein